MNWLQNGTGPTPPRFLGHIRLGDRSTLRSTPALWSWLSPSRIRCLAFVLKRGGGLAFLNIQSQSRLQTLVLSVCFSLEGAELAPSVRKANQTTKHAENRSSKPMAILVLKLRLAPWSIPWASPLASPWWWASWWAHCSPTCSARRAQFARVSCACLGARGCLND